MSRFNTGNPIGSADPRDRDDNSKNLDEAVNTTEDRWTDRLGNRRVSLAGAVDPTGFAQSALNEADRAEAEADRAETAADAAFVNAEVYDSIADGLESEDEQFQVVEGDEVVRYRRIDAEEAKEVARYPAAQFFDGMSRVESADLSHPVFDSDGILLSGYDDDGAFRADRARLNAVDFGGGDEMQRVPVGDFVAPFIDDDGAVVAGLRKDGVWAAEVLAAGLHEIEPVNHPIYRWLVRDKDGVILSGLTKDGRFLPGNDGESPDDHSVLASFVEPWLDPSENLVLSWVSTSETGSVVEYRVPRTSAWQAAASQRTRAFPELDGLYIHTAVIRGLNFSTVYECRWPGSLQKEKFATSPRSSPRVAVVSDFQSSNFADNSPMALLGKDIQGRGADILAIPGDHVSDDGQINDTTSMRWLNYLVLLQAHYRNPSDAMLPTFALIGNHEGSNSQGEGNAEASGNGIIGQIEDIFSWSYWDQEPNRFCNSASTFSVGNDLFVATLETNHTEPLSDQFPWLDKVVSRAYETHEHILVMGHAPAFYPGPGNRQFTTARELRKVMYPMLEPYASKILAYVCGHAHVLALTPKLRVMYDENLTDEENDERYTEDGLGLVQIGTGPVQATARPPERGDDVSDYDGTPMFVACMGVDDGDVVTTGTGITNVQDEINHHWILDWTSGNFLASAYGTHGLQYLSYNSGE